MLWLVDGPDLILTPAVTVLRVDGVAPAVDSRLELI
jgi:hypothetical protein